MFVNTVWAQDAAATAAPLGSEPTLVTALFQYAPIVFIFVIFYFLVIRPQTQAARDQQKMQETLKKGDVVVTDGGLVGEVAKVGDVFVHLRINAEDTVSVVRTAIRKTVSGDASKGWEPTQPAKKK